VLQAIGAAGLVTLLAIRLPASWRWLIGPGPSGLLFALFQWLAQKRGWRATLFAPWGHNPLTLYALHFLILALFTLPDAPGWYAEAPYWLLASQGLLLLTALTAVASWMERKQVVYGF
jgi:hypothetical protein